MKRPSLLRGPSSQLIIFIIIFALLSPRYAFQQLLCYFLAEIALPLSLSGGGVQHILHRTPRLMYGSQLFAMCVRFAHGRAHTGIRRAEPIVSIATTSFNRRVNFRAFCFGVHPIFVVF